MASQSGGGRTLTLVVLLVALVGGGAWNYQRNLAQEEARPRPYKGYTEADLRALADGYRHEIKQYEERWHEARGERAEARDTGLVGDAAREFDRVQSQSTRTRGLKSELADRQVVLEQIEEELSYRGSLGKGFQLHLRRLTSF